MSEPEQAYGSPITELHGKSYMANAKGALMPIENIRPMDRLEDEAVYKIMAFAEELSAQIARFKGHTFEDIGSLQALVAQEHGAKLGGVKGNTTLTSYDGRRRVRLQVQDQIDFGPELQAAKSLVDECLQGWAADSGEEMRTLVTRAFQVDQTGKINRNELFMLMRVDIKDERWQRGMKALRESIRVIGSKSYLRFETRDAPTAAWRAITIDLASA